MPDRTPSQTIGPFFHEALRWRDAGRATFGESGDRAVIVGRIVDGAGEPVADALIETWQACKPCAADASHNPHGFARLETGRDGTFRIETQIPGAPGSAPYLDVTILARGLLRALCTRVYLAAEDQVRADPALKGLAGSPRLSTLVARKDGNEWRWNVRLQGEGETIFFSA